MESKSFGRKIVKTNEVDFEIYDLDGKPQPEIELLQLSYDRQTRRGTYMMRMAPGAQTVEHIHKCREEFLILEGDLVENDGTVLGPGDYVCFTPGTRHYSRTNKGCLLIAFDWEN
jgi:quercetin dioxygenase-like cupin family protein